MLRLLAPIGVIFLSAAGLSGLLGCKQNSTDMAASAADASTPGASEAADSVELPEGWEPAIAPRFRGGAAAGTVDVSNRYASTIMLLADRGHVHASCSGILLNRRVALTAASCVCPPRQATPQGIPEKGPLGPDACAERAFIMTVRLGPVRDNEFKEELIPQTFGRVDGTVRIHPAFKLEIDDQGAVLSTQADLAIIVLDAPVKQEVPHIPFAETQVQENETLVMAGYGDDPRFRDIDGIRYFRHNKVTQIIEGLSLEVASPDDAREILALKGGDQVAF